MGRWLIFLTDHSMLPCPPYPSHSPTSTTPIRGYCKLWWILFLASWYQCHIRHNCIHNHFIFILSCYTRDSPQHRGSWNQYQIFSGINSIHGASAFVYHLYTHFMVASQFLWGSSFIYIFQDVVSGMGSLHIINNIPKKLFGKISCGEKHLCPFGVVWQNNFLVSLW